MTGIQQHKTEMKEMILMCTSHSQGS